MLKVVGVLQQSVLLSRFNLETLRSCSNVLTNFSNCIFSLQVSQPTCFMLLAMIQLQCFPQVVGLR